MKLYLVQHGQAKPEEEDPERTLTAKGRLDVVATGRFLEQTGAVIPEIWHSGKARAKETAEIIGQALGTVPLLKKEGMAPLDPVDSIWEALMNREEDLMLVGHLPFLSRLASMLLACPVETGIIGFRQGGVVCLERNEGEKWEVAFMVSPPLLK